MEINILYYKLIILYFLLVFLQSLLTLWIYETVCSVKVKWYKWKKNSLHKKIFLENIWDYNIEWVCFHWSITGVISALQWSGRSLCTWFSILQKSLYMVFYITVNREKSLYIVCMSVCPSVLLSVNFYIFVFFSRATGPILTRLVTNRPWMKGIQVCTNEGYRPSPRGDDSERVKMHWIFFKIFSRTSIQIQSNLVQIILG
jgi:hypothetical protein